MLSGKVAVVAGASRGAGRGIALGLGEAGATVYVVGRTTRSGPAPADGAPGTIEDTAGEVTARGGRGIPVVADCTREAEVAALFARVIAEHGRVDVAASAVWSSADVHTTMEEVQRSWSAPFWEQQAGLWPVMMAAPLAAYLVGVHAARAMASSGGGLIAAVTDGILDGQPADAYQGQMLWDLSHWCINRLMFAMAEEGRAKNITAVAVMPGFMRTERVVRHIGDNEKLKKMFRFDLSESTLYIGRGIAGLAADRDVMAKSGKILFVADLAGEYGFTDEDGRRIPRFKPF